MTLPQPPDLSHLPQVNMQTGQAKDGRAVLLISADCGPLPATCEEADRCTSVPCRHTHPIRCAHDAMTAAGWRMFSGSAAQGGLETRRYLPPPGQDADEPASPRNTPPQAPDAAPQQPEEQINRQTTLWHT